MKFTITAAALIALVPAVLGLTINTPSSVVQCQPVLLTWSGGTPPYYITLIPAGQVSAPALETFPTQTGNSLTWIVDQQQGASFNIAIKDNTGAVAYSDIVTVQPSSDKTCIGGSSNVSSPPSTGSTPTSTGAGSPNSSGGSSTRTGSSPSSTSSSGSNAANDASGLTLSSFGVAGVVGALAALF